jgi:hypothetical protein
MKINRLEQKQVATHYYTVVGKLFFSYLLWIVRIAKPKRTAVTIKTVLVNPLTPNDILIKIVEITNPEFLIIL